MGLNVIYVFSLWSLSSYVSVKIARPKMVLCGKSGIMLATGSA